MALEELHRCARAIFDHALSSGAVVDETTIERNRRFGFDPEDFLARSDSYSFFDWFNDLILTGPTGTNVRDVRIVLKSV